MRTLSIAFAAPLLTCGLVLSAAPSRAAAAVPYPSTPDWESDPLGSCGTGLAFADIDGDGWKDMVVSNGNDIAQQQLVVYYNQGDGSYPKAPSWSSADSAFNGNLAVGDVDGDGDLDVAVSVFTGPGHTYEGGGAKLYLNQGPPGFLEARPSWQVTGFPSFSLDLGDADGDGDLDLAVAAGNAIPEEETFAAQPDCSGPTYSAPVRLRKALTATGQDGPPFRSPGRIYYNSGGTFPAEPGWVSDIDLISYDVRLVDANQDGTMDAVFSDPATAVFFGDPDTKKIGTVPGWRTASESYFANGLGFAASLNFAPRGSRVPSILVSGNSYMGGGDGRFQLYRFTSTYVWQYQPFTASPSWTSERGGWGSGVRLADVNGDSLVDLLAARWAPAGSGTLGAPLLIYLGDGTQFSETPSFVSDTRSVGEILQVADLRRKGLRERSETFTVEEGALATIGVLTMSVQDVEGMLDVLVDGKRLDRGAWAAVPGGNTVSLASPLAAGQSATVRYLTSSVLDIGMTNWDCTKGNYIFYSRQAP
jgi:hypothetical protein